MVRLLVTDLENSDMLPAPSKSSIVSLTDGSRVLIRPIVPGDKALLKDEFARLSERSRYLTLHGSFHGSLSI